MLLHRITIFAVVVCHVCLCFVFLALDIHRVLYVGFFSSGVFPCGLLRTVFICWNYICLEVRSTLWCKASGVISWKVRVLLGRGAEGWGLKDLVGGYGMLII